MRHVPAECRKRSTPYFCLSFCILFFFSTLAFAQTNRPFRTEDVSLLPSGHMEFSAGFQMLAGFQNRVTLEEQRLYQFPVVAACIGLGNLVEFQVSGYAYNHLDVGNEIQSSPGDFSLFTKIRFNKGNGSLPSFGFRYGIKLPNAEETKGVGTDETDVYGELLCEKRWKGLKLFGSAGIAILGSPTTPSSQDDLFTFGAAAEIPIKNVSILGEVNGMTGDPNWDAARAGFGVKIAHHRIVLDAAFWDGFLAKSEDWGFTTGVTLNFKAF